MKNLSEFLSSKGSKITIGIIALVVIVGLSFSVGFMAGHRRAGIVSRRVVGYNQTINNGMMNGSRSALNKNGLNNGMMGRNNVQRNTGTSGTVTSMNGNNITIKGQNGVESTFAITAQTSIKNGSGAITVSGLAIGNNVTIVSLPNSTGTAAAISIMVNNVAATSGQ